MAIVVSEWFAVNQLAWSNVDSVYTNPVGIFAVTIVVTFATVIWTFPVTSS